MSDTPTTAPRMEPFLALNLMQSISLMPDGSHPRNVLRDAIHELAAHEKQVALLTAEIAELRGKLEAAIKSVEAVAYERDRFIAQIAELRKELKLTQTYSKWYKESRGFLRELEVRKESDKP